VEEQIRHLCFTVSSACGSVVWSVRGASLAEYGESIKRKSINGLTPVRTPDSLFESPSAHKFRLVAAIDPHCDRFDLVLAMVLSCFLVFFSYNVCQHRSISTPYCIFQSLKFNQTDDASFVVRRILIRMQRATRHRRRVEGAVDLGQSHEQ
jgi:hypothetical protein